MSWCVFVGVAHMFVSFYGSFLLFDDSPGHHLHFMAFHRPPAGAAPRPATSCFVLPREVVVVAVE